MSDDLTRTADSLAAADRARDALAPLTWGIVQAVNPDGTVTVTVDGIDRYAVPAHTGYGIRAKGDSVLVARTSQGPFVVGEPGTPTITPPPPQLQGVTFANTDPPTGAGWISITTNVWVKTGPPLQVWLKAATAPAPPAAATTATITVGANTAGTYRGGSLLAGVSYAEQGQYSGVSSGNQTGVFWFPSGAFSAASGKTINSVTAAVRRRSAPHGNTYGPEPVFAYNADGIPQQPSTPTLTGMGVNLGNVSLGETATGGLPTSYAAGLITGGGLAIYDSSSLHDVEADSCTVTIVYTL